MHGIFNLNELIVATDIFFQQPWLYDINSNIQDVKDFLVTLLDRLLACQNRSQEIKNYQKQFRVL